MKILAIPYTHTLSHVSRPLLVARELKRQGLDVVFAGSGPQARFIKDEGFDVLPLYEPDPGMLFGNIRRGNLRFVPDSEIERMVEADLAIYKEVRPAMVLTDGRFSAAISAQIAKVQHSAIVNASSTEYRALPYIPFFSRIPGVMRAGGVGRALDSINLKVEMLVFDNVMGVFKRLSNKYRLRRRVTATNCLCGADLTLLADIPEYFPTRNLPADYHYIGPLTLKSSMPAPAWWPPDPSRPLVYITMGTTGMGEFFRSAAELFRGKDMTAVITTGAQASIGATPENVHVEPYMDGDMVAKRSDLVVCHGGNGTIYQALEHGRPIVGLPTIPDQEFNMRRVEALGAGKALSWERFRKDPSTLMAFIDEVSADVRYSQSALAVKKILGGYDAPVSAASLILKSLGGNR